MKCMFKVKISHAQLMEQKQQSFLEEVSIEKNTHQKIDHCSLVANGCVE